MRTIFHWICPAGVRYAQRGWNGHFFAADRSAHVISPPPDQGNGLEEAHQIITVIDSNNLEHDGRAKTASHFSASCSGITAGYDAISGRGGTGRRAGFRFQ